MGWPVDRRFGSMEKDTTWISADTENWFLWTSLSFDLFCGQSVLRSLPEAVGVREGHEFSSPVVWGHGLRSIVASDHDFGLSGFRPV